MKPIANIMPPVGAETRQSGTFNPFTYGDADDIRELLISQIGAARSRRTGVQFCLRSPPAPRQRRRLAG